MASVVAVGGDGSPPWHSWELPSRPEAYRGDLRRIAGVMPQVVDSMMTTMTAAVEFVAGVVVAAAVVVMMVAAGDASESCLTPSAWQL